MSGGSINNDPASQASTPRGSVSAGLVEPLLSTVRPAPSMGPLSPDSGPGPGSGTATPAGLASHVKTETQRALLAFANQVKQQPSPSSTPGVWVLLGRARHVRCCSRIYTAMCVGERALCLVPGGMLRERVAASAPTRQHVA